MKCHLEYICSLAFILHGIGFKMDKASWVLRKELFFFFPPSHKQQPGRYCFSVKFCLSTTILSVLPALETTFLLLLCISQNYWSLTQSFTFIPLHKLIPGFLKTFLAPISKVQINRKVLRQDISLLNFPPL